MTARSLSELLKMQGKVTQLLLPRSPDLICNNLWCEHVTGPCVCRLEKVLQQADPNGLLKLDLSGNRLKHLPPSLSRLKALQHLDLSDNSLEGIPEVIAQLPVTQSGRTRLDGNPCHTAHKDLE